MGLTCDISVHGWHRRLPARSAFKRRTTPGGSVSDNERDLHLYCSPLQDELGGGGERKKNGTQHDRCKGEERDWHFHRFLVGERFAVLYVSRRVALVALVRERPVKIIRGSAILRLSRSLETPPPIIPSPLFPFPTYGNFVQKCSACLSALVNRHQTGWNLERGEKKKKLEPAQTSKSTGSTCHRTLLPPPPLAPEDPIRWDNLYTMVLEIDV